MNEAKERPGVRLQRDPADSSDRGFHVRKRAAQPCRRNLESSLPVRPSILALHHRTLDAGTRRGAGL